MARVGLFLEPMPALELKVLAGGHHLHLEAKASAQIAEWIDERLA